MKLYTEEQVINSIKSVKYYIEHYDANVIDSIIDKHLKALTPIELPSDEEIENTATNDAGAYFEFEFIQGAKWVIEQIKQQDSLNKLPISEWETGVDEQGGYWIEPITNKKWRWKSNEIIKQQDNGN